jgi:hypothetical protein
MNDSWRAHSSAQRGIPDAYAPDIRRGLRLTQRLILTKAATVLAGNPVC